MLQIIIKRDSFFSFSQDLQLQLYNRSFKYSKGIKYEVVIKRMLIKTTTLSRFYDIELFTPCNVWLFH